MTESLSFEDAIQLFKMWGFTVEPGPRPAEVSLIIAGADFRTCIVYDAHRLTQIAHAALQVRWQSVLQPEQTAETVPADERARI